jgi:hypothetical protein
MISRKRDMGESPAGEDTSSPSALSNINLMMDIDSHPALPFCTKDVKVKSTKAVITLLPPDFPPLACGRGVFFACIGGENT